MARSTSPIGRLLLPALVAVALTACGTGGVTETAPDASAGATGAPSESVTPSAAADMLLVVLGDSIPYNSPDDCPGCTGFADAYATAIGEAEGITVEVQNLSRHDGAGITDILEQVEGGDADEALTAADAVILSAGFNDQPPYWRSGAPCAGDVNSDDQAIDLLIATTPTCIADATGAASEDYARLLAALRERAPEAELTTLTAYNAWTGWAAFDARTPEDAAAAEDVVVSALEQWRDAACTRTAAVDGTCVDLLEPFNGADGRTAAGELLARDYTHPSQLGNDLIRDELLAAAP